MVPASVDSTLSLPRYARRRFRGEDGASLFEYVLLLALVTMVAVGSLVYLGQGSGSAAHVANNVSIGLSGGAGTSPAPPATDWCTSSSHGCFDTIGINGQQVVHFWASGGATPYSYSLSGAPDFVTLEDLDSTGGTGEVVIQPTSCSDAGTYSDIAIVVTGSGSLPANGQLTFSLNVSKGSC
jgi:Flp pilus assembly pilin Flp